MYNIKMVRKYSRSKRRVSRKVRRTKRKVRRTKRSKRNVRRTKRHQRGGLVGAAAVGLGLSALGYKIYNKRAAYRSGLREQRERDAEYNRRLREDYEALVHSDSSHSHMAAADDALHLRYGN